MAARGWTLEEVEQWDEAQKRGARVLRFEQIPEEHRKETPETIATSKGWHLFLFGKRCAAALPRASTRGSLFYVQCRGRVRIGGGIFCRVHRGGRRRWGGTK